MPDVTLDKKSLRAAALAARACIDPVAAKAASEAVAAQLLELIPAEKIVAGYLAIRGELDITPLLERLAARGNRICLPVVDAPGQPLSFRQWLPGQPLERGAHNIDVPMRQQFTLIPDIVLVPLVAFDKTGHRLGYGAGYYDRTIAALRGQKKVLRIIGVAYSMQQVDVIPAGEHDERLELVVTEKGAITI